MKKMNIITPSKSIRLEYIDVCKAIGIILVVLTHTYDIPYNLYISVFSFHMPFFFILSGFVYNKEKNDKLRLGTFIYKKFRQYMIPYFIFGFSHLIIIILWFFLSNQVVDFSFVFESIKGILLCTDGMPQSCSPLWFLMCLFISSLLFYLIMKINIQYQCIIMFCIVLSHFTMVTWFRNYLPFVYTFPTFLIALFFLWIGYRFRCLFERYSTCFHGKLLMSVSMCIIMINITIVLLTNNKINMRSDTYGFYFVFIVTSIMISLGLICLISNLTILSNRFFKWLGQNTIYVFGFNYLCLNFATEIYYYIPVVKNYPIHWLVSFLTTFSLCLLCIFLCNAIKNYGDF